MRWSLLLAWSDTYSPARAAVEVYIDPLSHKNRRGMVPIMGQHSSYFYSDDTTEG